MFSPQRKQDIVTETVGEWIAARAGMKYLVLTVMHHNEFCLSQMRTLFQSVGLEYSGICFRASTDSIRDSAS